MSICTEQPRSERRRRRRREHPQRECATPFRGSVILKRPPLASLLVLPLSLLLLRAGAAAAAGATTADGAGGAFPSRKSFRRDDDDARGRGSPPPTRTVRGRSVVPPDGGPLPTRGADGGSARNAAEEEEDDRGRRRPPPPPQRRKTSTVPSASSRIVGGQRTPSGSYPYATALYKRRPSDGELAYKCTGTLLAPNVVLSAAHCADPIDVAQVSRRNRYDPTEPYHERDVIGKLVHPKYDPKTYLYDFALLELSSDVEGVEPIRVHDVERPPLRDLTDGNGTGTVLTVMGWGRVSTEGEKSATLLEADVELWDTTVCQSSYGMYVRIDPDVTMCASIPGKKDACQGDSGGPLLFRKEGWRDVQVAVTSWGSQCGVEAFPGVYARMTAGYEWLNEKVCELNWDYCDGRIAAPPPSPTDETHDDGKGGTGELSETCRDQPGTFVLHDERKNKRYSRTCEWVRRDAAKSCRIYGEYCPETCREYFTCL